MSVRSVVDVCGGIDKSPPRSARSRSKSAAEAVRITRAGRPTATTSSGSDIPARNERALAEEHPVADPGAGHEDGGVADLAEVADGGADDQAAMTERGAAPDDGRDHC